MNERLVPGDGEIRKLCPGACRHPEEGALALPGAYVCSFIHSPVIAYLPIVCRVLCWGFMISPAPLAGVYSLAAEFCTEDSR